MSTKLKDIFKESKKMLSTFVDGSFYKILIILIVFLLGLGFFNLTGVFLVLLLVAASILCFLSGRMIFDRQFILVLLFSFFFTSITCFWKIHYHEPIKISYLIQFLISPPIMYSFGRALFHPKSKIEKQFAFVFEILLSWIIGLFIRGFMSIVYYVTYTGFFFQDRRYFDIWTKSYTNSTLLTTFFYLIMALFVIYVFIYNKKGRPWFYVLLLIPLFICVFSLSELGVRSPFLNIAILFIALAYYLFGMISEKARRISFIIFIILLILFFSFVIAVYLNAFNILSLLAKIPVLMRFFQGGSDSERLNLYIEFFKKFIFYPFGNLGQSKALGTSYFTHNVWLDTYSFGGLLSFLPFVILTINELIIMLRLLKNRNNNRVVLCIVFVTFALFQVFLFEPVIQGNVYFFLFQFVLFGGINGIYHFYLSTNKQAILYSKKYDKVDSERPVVLLTNNKDNSKYKNSVIFVCIDSFSLFEIIKLTFHNNYLVLTVNKKRRLILFFSIVLCGDRILQTVFYKKEDECFKLFDYNRIVLNGVQNVQDICFYLTPVLFFSGSITLTTIDNYDYILSSYPLYKSKESSLLKNIGFYSLEI